MHEVPQSKTTPFHRTTEREVYVKDKKFIGKIMKMDWRDRPTAKELLEDEWFKEGKMRSPGTDQGLTQFVPMSLLSHWSILLDI
jgi:hypothetical protein